MTAPGSASIRADKLGVLITAIIAYGVVAAPFVTFRANRIVPGQGRTILEALPAWASLLLLSIIVAAGIVALVRTPVLARLGASIAALIALVVFIGVTRVGETIYSVFWGGIGQAV